VGSEAEAKSYYASLGSEFVTGTYTLSQWAASNIGTRPVFTGFYRNGHELGFWREMTCTKYVGRGIGGCMVRNWSAPDDQAHGKPDLGTVTMNVSPEGFTRFFVFAPGGKLSPFAILDDEGAKYVPRVCVACHNGSYDASRSDVRAIFREFEPSLLEPLPGRPAAQEWFDLNQSVRSANAALKTEQEGGAAGIDHAKLAQSLYVREIYTSTSPPVSLDVRDPAHVPASWAALGDTPTLLRAKKNLWTRVVAPYCMTCHRTNDEDWSDYKQFDYLAGSVGGTPFLDLYLADPAHHTTSGFPFMPQAKLLYSELQSDATVQTVIDDWVNALGNPRCEVGTTCTPSKLCFNGEITVCGTDRTACTPTSAVADGTPCGTDRTCNRGVCTDTIVISIPRINEGIYVRNENPDKSEAHVHASVGGGHLFIAQVAADVPCTKATTEVTLGCSTATLTCTDPSSGDSWKVVTGNTLRRTNPRRPEVEGTYRLESPVQISTCP
jgi:hypothetical protein